VTDGLLKSVSFGLLSTWICAYKGFYARPGAVGVGRATTDAVVVSIVTLLMVDYFITAVLAGR
jgi:phospholipid/cholesterol/gamma-HCH transport system permease protein